MNWDALERGIDKEDIKWTRRKFGTFAAGVSKGWNAKDKVKLSKKSR
jgi:hypothetical protein